MSVFSIGANHDFSYQHNPPVPSFSSFEGETALQDDSEFPEDTVEYFEEPAPPEKVDRPPRFILPSPTQGTIFRQKSNDRTLRSLKFSPQYSLVISIQVL